MLKNELENRLQERLKDEIDDPKKASSLAAKLIEAVTDRLVLLVAPELDYIGFEVRSLQEYSAARALISGPDADIIPRLEALAQHPSWRNTWLLAAAGVFALHPHLRSDLVNALRTVDALDRTTMTLLPGAQLALSLLDEDLARQHPRHQNLLVQHAAELITQSAASPITVANVLVQAASRHDQANAHLERAAKNAVSSRGVRLMNGFQILARWAKTPGQLGSASQQLLEAAVRRMNPEERAAARLFSVEKPWVRIPGLAAYRPVRIGHKSLADFIDLDRKSPEASRFITYFRRQDVYQLDIDGFTVHYVEPNNPFDVPLLEHDDAVRQVEQAIVNAIEAQQETGWHVAVILTGLLEQVLPREAPQPRVLGII
ncbi:hypothetical protein C7C46_04060 [Streptomyces tateyamensis]|uniref:Uncharacterized protein n=2 Tax=Streptomyces tateyamensis TaxID=565073 RepID=A0A2V4P1W5_9ACTN|nr:hypothetical protein C7C46_04060 [Streptomyces tateyamensis]